MENVDVFEEALDFTIDNVDLIINIIKKHNQAIKEQQEKITDLEFRLRKLEDK